MIVDDRPMNRQYLVTLLGYFGHGIFEASDGQEALKVARAERPDMIISDMVMPEMDGEDLAVSLRRDPRLAGIPVIFYSATYSLIEAQAVAKSVGAYGVLRKPSDPEVILALVNKALGLSTAAVPGEPPPGAVQGGQTPPVLGRLPDDLSALEAVSYRLGALIEMSLELAAERDPDRLLEGVAHMARKLIPSKYAAVALLEEDGSTIRYCMSGGREDAAGETAWPADSAAMRAFIEGSRPPLAVVLRSGSRALGWLLLRERLGAGRFNDDDRRLAETLASQAASTYQKVAERKQAEERVLWLNRELKARVDELQLANRSLEAFGYSVSHDLREPLRAIEGFVGILSEDHRSSLGPEPQRLLDVIGAKCRRMGGLIDGLLDFSRISRVELRRSEVDMGELAQSVAKELGAAEPSHRVEVTVDPLPPAFGDPTLLRSVFTNLISNARKFTRRTAGARIAVGSRREHGEPVYCVRDNGAGFAPEFAWKLFGVFQRLHSEQEFEGIGIGLALASRIVQRHGGRIWAESDLGKGAAFYFSLSATPSEAVPAEPSENLVSGR